VFGGIVEAEKSDMIQYIQREKYQNIILLEEIANL
jgi:hypothetical protein